MPDYTELLRPPLGHRCTTGFDDFCARPGCEQHTLLGHYLSGPNGGARCAVNVEVCKCPTFIHASPRREVIGPIRV